MFGGSEVKSEWGGEKTVRCFRLNEHPLLQRAGGEANRL